MISALKHIGIVAAFGLAAPVEATIFWSNFEVGTVVVRTTGGAWPTVERAPLDDYDNGAARVGVNTAYFYDTSFQFSVDSTFVANRAIMALQLIQSFGGQRIIFGISERNDATGSFTSLGSLQIQANGLSRTAGANIREIDAAFGTNGTSEERLFDFRPIQFTAGRTYRIGAGHAAGAGGVVNWFLSDTVAAQGTATQVLRGGTGQFFAGNGSTALGFQPTLALTDGGALVPAVNAVPEPGSWALMIVGFGLVGANVRRRRAGVAIA